MIKKLLQSSSLLFVFNLLAGGMNYVFVLLSARHLSAADLGTLNLKLNTLNIIGTIGVMLQSIAVVNPISQSVLLRLRRYSLIIYALCALPFWLSVAGVLSLPETVLFFLGLLPLLTIQFWFGILQKQLQFLALGMSMVLFALPRVIGGSLAHSLDGFTISLLLGGAFALPFVLFLAQPREESARSEASSLYLATLVGFAYVLLPSYDFFNVRIFLGNEPAGQFSRLQLFSKILYYAPITLLQVTLPHYVQAYREGKSSDHLRAIRRLEIVGLGVCYLAALAFGFAAPLISEKVLGIVRLDFMPVLLACLSVPPLYGLLSSLQLAVAAKSARVATSVTALPLGSFLILALIRPTTLTQLLSVSAGYNTFIALISLTLVMRAGLIGKRA